MAFQTSGAARAVVRNFRKIAAAHKGRLILRYFTKNTLEPIYPPALDGAGRTLEKGDASALIVYIGRDSRATWRPDIQQLSRGRSGSQEA